jgi:hypothetical protein
MKQIDRAAMQLAIDQMRAEGGNARAQIEDKLATESFAEAGQTAAYHGQCKALRLRPWQPPPMYAQPRADGPDDGIMGHRAAELLLQRMLAAGLSRFEPDPLKAIERVERERAA